MPLKDLMPLARIIGQFPEAAQSLIQELRARGYEVETVPASDAISSNPDLEVTLQECSADDMLSNVIALMNGEDSSVVVSPGALSSLARTTSEEPQSIQRVEPVAVELDASELIAEQPPAIFEGEVHLADEVVKQAALANEGHESELAETISQPLGLSNPKPEEPIEQSCLQYATDESEKSQSDYEQPQLEQMVEAEVNADALLYAELFKASENLSLPEADAQTSVADSLQSRMVYPEVTAFQSSEVFSDWPIWNASAAEEVAPQVVAQRRRLKAHVQDFRPHADRIIAEVVRLRAQAARSISDLWSASQRVLATSNATRILRNDRLFTRVAIGATSLAVVLLLITATAHRFSPLPASIVQGYSEALRPAPFQKTASASVPTTATAIQAPATPQLSRSLTGLRHFRGSMPAAPLKVTHRPPAENEFVAKNTVVRYTQHVASGIAGEVQQPGVKYYTDLKENR